MLSCRRYKGTLVALQICSVFGDLKACYLCVTSVVGDDDDDRVVEHVLVVQGPCHVADAFVQGADHPAS